MTLTEPPPPALVDRITRPLSAGLAVGITATGVYGGYFGAAQGVVLLALLGIAWSADLHRANGAKVVLAGMANLVSASVFAFSGKVDWRIAAPTAEPTAISAAIRQSTLPLKAKTDAETRLAIPARTTLAPLARCRSADHAIPSRASSTTPWAAPK